MEPHQLLRIISRLVEGEHCGEIIELGIVKHCTNTVTHIGENSDARCAEHLSHFTMHRIEYVPLVTTDGELPLESVSLAPQPLTGYGNMRWYAPDPAALREVLADSGLYPRDIDTIVEACSDEYGLTMRELANVILRAAANKLAKAAIDAFLCLPCPRTPGCQLSLPHKGECETEVPW